MLCFTNCLSENSGMFEMAVFARYIETDAEAAPGHFDDALAEPILVDTDGDGVGEYDRTPFEEEVKVPGAFEWYPFEEEEIERSGDMARTRAMITVLESHLRRRGLIRTDGRPTIQPNDRLVRVEDMAGSLRLDLTIGRDGVFVYSVRPGETGSGYWIVLLEDRTIAART